ACPELVGGGLRMQGTSIRSLRYASLLRANVPTQGERTYSGRTDLLRVNGSMCTTYPTLHRESNSYKSRAMHGIVRHGGIAVSTRLAKRQIDPLITQHRVGRLL